LTFWGGCNVAAEKEDLKELYQKMKAAEAAGDHDEFARCARPILVALLRHKGAGGVRQRTGGGVPGGDAGSPDGGTAGP
jgi:hypothetical protein